jgi:CelD/BcsL family acetyltransferase involved in cellulose biosynthesis
MSKIEVHHQDFSKVLCNDRGFLKAWQELWMHCPWATVFQSPDFVRTWFECFRDYQPTIITDWDGKSLTGIWVLTKVNRRFAAPGFDLAEYQVWLSTPQDQEGFVEAALKAFANAFPKHHMNLKYMPNPTPLGVFERSQFLKSRTVLRPYQQPLMVADKASLQEELKKKNRKEKINRLNRLGKLEFAKVSDLETFRSQIDEMALQSDFRKGALYNKTFFHAQPERKEFLLRLFALGHVHVTTLSVGDTLIASNAGIMSPQMVHLQGINSHSPFFSKHSPGILHFLMLGIALADEGIPVFDLTPGGADGYKAVLANKQQTAYEWWFGTRSFAFKKRTIETLKARIKSRLEQKPFWGLDWQGVQEKIKGFQAKAKSLKKVIRASPSFATNFLAEIQESSLDSLALDKLGRIGDSGAGGSTNFQIRKNHIPDLFLWQEKHAGIPRSELFLDCLNRIEFGQQMFTLTDGESLISVAWHIPSDAKMHAQEARNQPTERPPIVLCSCYHIGREKDIIALLHEILSQVPADIQPKVHLQFSPKQKALKALILNS